MCGVCVCVCVYVRARVSGEGRRGGGGEMKGEESMEINHYNNTLNIIIYRNFKFQRTSNYLMLFILLSFS